MPANGMFDSIFRNLRQEEQDEEEQLQYLAQDPSRATAHAAYSGAAMAGKGLGRAVAGMAGQDPRTPQDRMQGAMKALGELEEADMNTPAGVDAYYKRVIDTLRQHGLPGEAHAAAQEWHKHKNEQADRQVKIDETNRKKAEGERAAAIKEEANRIKALRAQQLAAQGLPEFIQIVDRIEREQNPTVRKLLMDRANQQAGGKVKFEEAGDRIVVRNERGDILGVDEIGEKPMDEKDRVKSEQAKQKQEPAYRSAMQALQTQYKAAADLYNSPGLDDLIGKWTGLAAEYGLGQDGMLAHAAVLRLSPEGQEAMGVYQQIIGGAFVNALQQLKAAGGGSTGLGQVTEVEGKKITTATNALFPRQQPASFRRKLADYIDTLEATAEIMRDAAKSDGLTPIELNVVPLSGPQRGAAPVVAPTRPRSDSTSAPRAGGDRVRVRRPDGATGTIPRAKLEDYKAKGYTEIK
jgi:hypothetical protein